MGAFGEKQCCVEHLERTGRGVISGNQFITNAAHCRDGERARCNVCHRVWEHICDEAEGCFWFCRSKLQQVTKSEESGTTESTSTARSRSNTKRIKPSC